MYRLDTRTKERVLCMHYANSNYKKKGEERKEKKKTRKGTRFYDLKQAS